MKPPFSQCREKLRKLSRGASGVNPLGSSVFGQSELLDAIGEHRGISGRNIELSRIDLGDVCEKLRCRDAILEDERGEAVKKSRVIDMTQCVPRQAIRNRSGWLQVSTYLRGGSCGNWKTVVSKLKGVLSSTMGLRDGDGSHLRPMDATQDDFAEKPIGSRFQGHTCVFEGHSGQSCRRCSVSS